MPLTEFQKDSFGRHSHGVGQVVDPDTGEPIEAGGGEHPDLAAHNTLGLATQSELDAVAAAKANTSHSHSDGDLPAGIARDSEVTSAISTHEGGAAHTGLATDAEVSSAISTHEGGSAHSGLATDAELASAVNGMAKVYVHGGSTYALTGGRIFIGPEDPASDGFTLADGDQWEDTSA